MKGSMNTTPFQKWFAKQKYRALEDSSKVAEAAWNGALDALNSHETISRHMALARTEAGCPDDETLVEHCRNMRTELDAANAKIEQYNKLVDDIIGTCFGRDEHVVRFRELAKPQ